MSFVPLNIDKEDSLARVLYIVDHAIQVGKPRAAGSVLMLAAVRRGSGAKGAERV